jgi:hypothetical protein
MNSKILIVGRPRTTIKQVSHIHNRHKTEQRYLSFIYISQTPYLFDTIQTEVDRLGRNSSKTPHTKIVSGISTKRKRLDDALKV